MNNIEMINNKDFFDHLAADYNRMINFENSLKNKTNSLKRFIKSKYKYALDLGCGTGADSIALANLGLIVDAVDHSKEMIEQARKNADKVSNKIKFYSSSITDLGNVVEESEYDIIVSLGNTLANISSDELKELINSLSKLLSKVGVIIIQLINFKALPNSGEYLLNKKEDDSGSITRKYNISKEDVDFIIERYDRVKNQNDVMVTKLYPHSKENFLEYARKNGLRASFFGSLNMESYSEYTSQNLVVLLEN